MHPILSSSPSSLLSFLDDIEKIKNGTNPIEKNPDFPPSQELDTSHSEFSPPLGSHNPSHEVDSDTDTDVEGEDDHEEQIRDRADTSVDLTQSKLESYKYCLNVLKIDEPTSEAGKRALASEIRKIDAFKLDDAEANALVTLGNLFQHGYYESEKGYEQTNSSMALLCYKKLLMLVI